MLLNKLPKSVKIILGFSALIIFIGTLSLTILIISLDLKEEERKGLAIAAYAEADHIREALHTVGRLILLPPDSTLDSLSWLERSHLNSLTPEIINLVKKRKPEAAGILEGLKGEIKTWLDAKTPEELEADFEKVFLEYSRNENHVNAAEASFILEMLKSKLPPEDPRVEKTLEDLKPSPLTEEEWNQFKAPLIREISTMIATQNINIDRMDVILKSLEKERTRYHGHDDLIPFHFSISERSNFQKTICSQALAKASHDFDTVLKDDSLSHQTLTKHVENWARILPILKSCAKTEFSPNPQLDLLVSMDKVREHFLLPAWQVFKLTLHDLILHPDADQNSNVQKAIETLTVARKRYGDFMEESRNNYSLSNWKSRTLPEIIQEAYNISHSVNLKAQNLSDAERDTLREIMITFQSACDESLDISPECNPLVWRTEFGSQMSNFVEMVNYFSSANPYQRYLDLAFKNYNQRMNIMNKEKDYSQLSDLQNIYEKLVKLMAKRSLKTTTSISKPESRISALENSLLEAVEDLANLVPNTSESAKLFKKSRCIIFFEELWLEALECDPQEAVRLASLIREYAAEMINLENSLGITKDLLVFINSAILRYNAGKKFIDAIANPLKGMIPSRVHILNDLNLILAKRPKHNHIPDCGLLEITSESWSDTTYFTLQALFTQLAELSTVQVTHLETYLQDLKLWVDGVKTETPVIVQNNMTMQKKLIPSTASAFYYMVNASIKYKKLLQLMASNGIFMDFFRDFVNCRFVDFTDPFDDYRQIFSNSVNALPAENKKQVMEAFFSFLYAVMLNLGHYIKLLQADMKDYTKDSPLLLLSNRHQTLGKAMRTAWQEIRYFSAGQPLSEHSFVETRLSQLHTNFKTEISKIPDCPIPSNIQLAGKMQVLTFQFYADRILPIFWDYHRLLFQRVVSITATKEDLRELKKAEYKEDMSRIVSDLTTVFCLREYFEKIENVKVDAQNPLWIAKAPKHKSSYNGILKRLNEISEMEIEQYIGMSATNLPFVTAIFDDDLPDISFFPYYCVLLAAQNIPI